LLTYSDGEVWPCRKELVDSSAVKVFVNFITSEQHKQTVYVSLLSLSWSLFSFVGHFKLLCHSLGGGSEPLEDDGRHNDTWLWRRV